MSSFSRRTWLKSVAAASAAASATASTTASAFRVLRSPEAAPDLRQVPTFCELCFWNCGLVAHAHGNRVHHLTGHPDHPAARGKLCGRGNAGAAVVTDPDRLRYPMVRTGKRGEGRFERVGWPTAYRRIAEGMQRIKAAHGARALALFYHGKGGPLFRTLMAAYGVPNFAAPAYAQCKGPRDVGYKLTFGEKLGSPEPLDLPETRCMVLFGSHLGENTHNSQVQELVKARARGASLIVLDPRLSTVAAKADLWLPLRPGSDIAVLLAWMHLLVEHHTYHSLFVERQCVGFEELARHVQPFTPAWAAAEAGVPAADIERAYQLMVRAMPAVLIHPGRHVTWYGEVDTQRARAQAILTALLGAFWTRGGIYRPSSPKVADFPAPDLPELPPDVDRAAGRFPFAHEVTTNGIREATRSGKPYPIKGWFVHATNLLQSMPNMHQTLEAIEKLDLLVVCDVQPTEITRYADVLLPEDTYLERYDDLQLGAGRRPYIALRQPVVASPHDTRPAWRIARDLARALGVGDFFAFETMEEYLAERLRGSGTGLEELRKKGIAFQAPDAPPYLDPSVPFHWHTPSGKVELYSRQLADKGFSPLPVHRPQPLPPTGMMRMLYGRSPLHSFARTQNNEILFDLDPVNCLWMNPRCGEALGVKNGDPVFVENAHGDRTGPMPARLSARIQERTIHLVHGFGQDAPGLHLAHGSGGSDTKVLDEYAVDPISGGTGMRVQFVRVTPARPGERQPTPPCPGPRPPRVP
jgi:thiosulfate reductase / polysulfide reductase chain A